MESLVEYQDICSQSNIRTKSQETVIDNNTAPKSVGLQTVYICLESAKHKCLPESKCDVSEGVVIHETRNNNPIIYICISVVR